MKTALTALLLVALTTGFQPAFADEAATAPIAQQAGSVAIPPEEVQYRDLKDQLQAKIKKLAGLGAGVTPFENRLNEIDQSSENNWVASSKSLSSLNDSVESQLKSIAALRAPKPVAAKPAVSLNPQVAQMLAARGVAPQGSDMQKIVNRLATVLPESKGSLSSLVNNGGTADGFLENLANQVASRELGGLGIPVSGPFLLERFRNLQRVNQLRSEGRQINSFLDYWKRTEEQVKLAKRDNSRLSELSSQVSYLQQQLGLQPLSGSVHKNPFDL